MDKRLTPARIALLYAAFAALWIFASDKLLALAIRDPELITRISIYKGFIFVFVTSWLLYLLIVILSHQTTVQTHLPDTEKHNSRGTHNLFAIFLCLALIVPLFEFGIAKLYEPRILQAAFADLASIAELKTNQIESWLREWNDDANDFSQREGFIERAERWLKNRDQSAKTYLLERMDTFANMHEYDPVLLAPDGKPELAASFTSDPVAEQTWRDLLAKALLSSSPQHSDLYRDSNGKSRLDFVVPLFLQKPRRLVGAIVLRAPVERFLFPLIQSWPTPSLSAETVLIRREGNQVLHLNELRHRKNTAMVLRMPLDSHGLISAATIQLGKPATMEGSDYRGKRVLAATHPIKDTDWYLVAKVDLDEAMELPNEIFFWLGLIAILIVVAVASAVLLIWRQQQRMHQMELAARSAEQDKQLKLFYDLPFIGMVITSPSSKKWLYANDCLCEMLGYSREELLQTTWTELTHPDDLSLDMERFERLIAGEIDGYKMEKRFIHKNGSTLTVNLDVKCTREADGRPDRIIAMLEDISERKHAELALRESEQKLKDAQRNAHLGYYDIDLISGIVVWSEELFKIFGIDPSTFQPTFDNYRELLHKDDIELVYNAFGECVRERKPFELSYRIVNSKGDIRHALSKANVTTDTDGNVFRMFGTLQDITDLKRAEMALRKSEATYRSLFENMLNGIAHCRMILRDGVPVDYEFISVNPGWVQMTGLKDAIGRKISEVIPGYCEANQDSLQIFGKVAQDGEPTRWEHYLAALDKWFSFSIYSPAQGEFVVVTDDITERNKAEVALRESEERFRNIFDNVIDGILLADPESQRFTLANPAMENMLGYSHEEIIQLGLSDIHIAEELPDVMVDFNKRSAGEILPTTNVTLKRKDGSQFNADINTSRITINGRTYLMGIFRDVTERMQAEDAIRQSATVFQSSHNGIIVTDLDGRIRSANQAYQKITGYSEEELLGQNPRIMHSGRQGWEFYRKMWSIIEHTGIWQGELWNRRKNGEVYPTWLAVSAVKNDQGEATHYVGISSDLSQLRQSEAEREHLAHYDPLTDLPNRLLLQSHLTHAVAQARRQNTQLGALYIDLDRFKNINDSMGYQIGDELLVTLTERLTMHLRSEDLLARLGGDEFLLVVEHINNPEDTAIVARSLLDSLSQPFILPGGQEIFIGASIGISVFPNDGDSAELLIQHADSAMHQAKNLGRNTYRFYTEELTRTSGERLEMENRLRHAISTNQLLVYYQPQVDIATGHIIGAEALVRWQGPERGLIQPIHFIQLAEETGLIGAIGEWVLKETCLQGMRWIEAGLPYLTLAVNLSPHQFLRGNIAELVSKVLAETGFPADRLELELTESALMQQEQDVIKMLHLLRAQDIRLAIDDFGTGYSSLSYLKRFPLDILKIDKSFVDDIPFHQDDMEIASTIIAMGHILGFKVLAEGVETAEQLEFLQAKGCDLYQGYLTSPPVPANEFEQLLRGK